MKQFQLAYENDISFQKELEVIDNWRNTNPSYTTIFKIYAAGVDSEDIRHICDMLDEKMPDALYLGCASHANILDGALANAEITISCTIFEYETTRVKLLQLPFTEDRMIDAARELKDYCDTNEWVSSVEMHATILSMPMRAFCEEMCTLRSDIQVFGGGACNPDISDVATTVFSKGNGISAHGIIFVLLGGSDFHTYSMYISGWNPLERKFKVTRAERAIVYELDGEPAFNIYRRFLNIENNYNLVPNTLEFPLLMNDDGIDVLRSLIRVNDDDNSIIYTSEVPEGSDVRLAYGDPEMILTSIRHDGQNIADFQPDVIQVFSCAARKAFWSDENVSDETLVLNSIAPTSGFYTSGEFLRMDGIVRNFNSTLVIAAMREGEPRNEKIISLYDAKLSEKESKRINLIRRFNAFIAASTAEFEELNRKLVITSITDGLTKLYNRAEIESRIRSALEERSQEEHPNVLSLIMIDIDDFKKINDVYGHKEGDSVIIGISDVLRNVMNGVPSSAIGRWGGEEFMVLLPDSDINEAVGFAEKIRTEFAAITYELSGSHTVSIGVAQAKDGEDADALYCRVDEGLYMAKANGKNQIVKQD